VSALLGEGVAPTRRAHARALTLLERYGVLSRDAIAYEDIAGGFAAVYPVLREMEEAGKLRRGHFVASLRGAQFAMAPIVDQLRATRADRTAEEAVLLAATDPANPFGVQLPWPPGRAEKSTPRRAVGASVVIVDGELALFLDRAGRSVSSFAPHGDVSPATILGRAAKALHGVFEHRRRAALRIETIDGESATSSVWAEAFVRAGFRSDYKGLVLERSEASAR
jgi:ATP-dependent Lhr-like helicase